MLSEFAKVKFLKRKSDMYKWLIYIMQRMHFEVRLNVFNCQQTLTKISFVIFDIMVIKKNEM